MKKIFAILITISVVTTGCLTKNDNNKLIENINNTLQLNNYRSKMTVTVVRKSDSDVYRSVTTLLGDHDKKKKVSKIDLDYKSNDSNIEYTTYIDLSNNDVVNKYIQVVGTNNWNKVEESVDYFEESNEILNIIKNSKSISKEDNHYVAILNGESIRELVDYGEVAQINYVEPRQFEDYNVKIYTNNKYISKVTIDLKSTNVLNEEVTTNVIYEFYDYNKVYPIEIPGYVINSDEKDIIDEALYGVAKANAINYVSKVEKEIIIEEIKQTGKIIVDKNNNVVTDNISVKPIPEMASLKYINNKINGVVMYNGHVFNVVDSEIIIEE